MGRWLFFSTGFDYKLHQATTDVEELNGEKMYSLIDDIFDDFKFRYIDLISKYENKFNITECICCLEDMNKIENREVVLPCFHAICNRCLYATLKRSNNCPICRSDFIKKSIKDEMCKIFSTDIEINDEFFYKEEEYEKIIKQDSILKSYVDHCVKWKSSNIGDVRNRIQTLIISSGNENKIQINMIDEYEKSKEGTETLWRKLLETKTDENGYKIYLGIIILHQLHYTDELLVRYSK